MLCLRRRVAVVGNGKVALRHADEIDSHDFVIRFNACSNFGLSGLNTDLLVLVNTGLSGMRLARNAGEINPVALHAAKSFLFARAPDLIALQRDRRPIPPDAEDQFLWTDFSAEIIESHIRKRKWKFLPSSLYWRAQKSLEAFGATEDHEPSTGMLALFHLREKLRPQRITLYGFTHQGWPGHAWEAERALVAHWGLTYGDLPEAAATPQLSRAQLGRQSAP